jgi:hypothetical protein
MQAWEDNSNDTSICNLLKAKAMGEYFLLLYSYLGLIILSSYNTSRSKAKAHRAGGQGASVRYRLLFAPRNVAQQAHCFWHRPGREIVSNCPLTVINKLTYFGRQSHADAELTLL